MSKRRSLRGLLVLAVAIASLLAPVLSAAPAGADVSHALIQGYGSSWAANALNQWVTDVTAEGIQVVYTPDGDAQGRADFANNVADFAVTSIGYQGRDPLTGQSDTSQGRPFAYLPIAAGGTAFPYHIVIDGQQVNNLRLSGETLAKIFTDKITNWDDPEITADNNGIALPSLPIVPVVQSEGSGATYQLTEYFATDYGDIWGGFAGSNVPTEYFPRQGDQIAQNGSNGAMNYVVSSAANGSIAYVEYSYALQSNYPVVALLNQSGYFVLPTQYNDAVALENAQIDENPSSPTYLLQTLTNVYTDPDPRAYPLSSYVYAIEPTGTNAQDSKMTTAKRQSIADFLYYSICQGQREIGPTGYSPLPVNLVEAGFLQIAKLQAADPGVDLTNRDIASCGNPTFVASDPNENYLAQIAPYPPACAHVGAGPCVAGTGNPESPTYYASVANAGSTAKPTSSSGTSSGSAGASSDSSKGGWRYDPKTHQLIPPNGLGDDSLVGATLPTNPAALPWVLLAGALVVLGCFMPTLVSRRRSRRALASKDAGPHLVEEPEGGETP